MRKETIGAQTPNAGGGRLRHAERLVCNAGILPAGSPRRRACISLRPECAPRAKTPIRRAAAPSPAASPRGSSATGNVENRASGAARQRVHVCACVDRVDGAWVVQDYVPPRASLSPCTSEFETGLRGGAPGGRSSRVLLMGLKRSGKTSIYQVVFHKMSPHETLFLESTVKTVHHDVRNNSVVHFRVSDFPGGFSPEEQPGSDRSVFANAEAVLFIIDAQDDLQPAISRLVATIEKAYPLNRRIYFEVFIHKVDGLTEQRKLQLQREVSQQVTKQLALKQLDDANLALYLSSIYDQSIYENVSKVVQKLVPSLAILENLLDVLISNCHMQKAFLFDVLTKVYLATDSQPVDVQSFELASDMLDVVVDVSCIYGEEEAQEVGGLEADGAFDKSSASVISLSNGLVLYMRQVPRYLALLCPILTECVLLYSLLIECVLLHRQVSRYLALVCIMRAVNLERKGLIDYNVELLKEALRDVTSGRTFRTPRQSLASLASLP